MERLGKRRLNVCMALVAEGGLIRFEQGGLRFGLVDTVATGAADESIAMGGPVKIRVIANMASQASLSNLFRGCCCESKDLGRIPAAIDMGLAGSVAALACHSLAAVLKCQLGMRISGEALHLVLMAGGAGLLLRQSLPDSLPSWTKKSPQLAAQRHARSDARERDQQDENRHPTERMPHAQSPRTVSKGANVCC